MTKLVGVMLMAVVVALTGAAWAFNCPVVIKQAEDMLKKAEAKPNADTKLDRFGDRDPTARPVIGVEQACFPAGFTMALASPRSSRRPDVARRQAGEPARAFERSA